MSGLFKAPRYYTFAGRVEEMADSERTLTPSEDVFEDFVRVAGKLLAVPIEGAWVPSICSNLSTALAMANLVSGFSLPDGAEPAPRYDLEPD
jgi:hypothetical protein